MLLSSEAVPEAVNVAVLSVPPATVPPAHLAVLFHEVTPDEFHVPLWANTLAGHACTAMTATTAAEIVSHRGRNPMEKGLTPVVILAMSVTSKNRMNVGRTKETRQSLFGQHRYVIPRLTRLSFR
jgi:hypothetical protein